MFEHDRQYDAVANGELLLFRTLWNHTDDNMFIVLRDQDGSYISEKSNRAMEKTFKLEPGQLDGVALRTLLDDEVYALVSGRYDECIALERPITYNESATIEDAGGTRHWNTTILPVMGAEDGLVRIIGISREITALVEAERVLKENQSVLEEEVVKRTEALSQAFEKMKRLSNSDKLTGLCNRLRLDTVLEEKISLVAIEGPFTLLMLDIDNFKAVNDTYGHQVGDVVLKEFAEILTSR